MKERRSCSFAALTYKKIPKQMIICLVYNAIFWINLFPWAYEVLHNIIENLIYPPGIEQRDRLTSPGSWTICTELWQTRLAGHHKKEVMCCYWVLVWETKIPSALTDWICLTSEYCYMNYPFYQPQASYCFINSKQTSNVRILFLSIAIKQATCGYSSYQPQLQQSMAK